MNREEPGVPEETKTQTQDGAVHADADGNPAQPAEPPGEVHHGVNTETMSFRAAPEESQPAADSRKTPRRRQFGGYELLEEIAHGGMGVVYKARQVKLDRLVALKMILAGEFASDQAIQRFYTEARAAAHLDHPHIVPIYEIGEHEGQHFFSMALVEGGTLQQRIQAGPLAPAEAAKLVACLAEAMQYAHDHHVLHRDLKPHNVLLDHDGQPKISDFGLARQMDDAEGMTASGDILGTPSYMAPEQALGKVHECGPATDIYALGAILYCLLTARPPFQTASKSETLRQVVEREPVSPRAMNPATPRDLETICLKCLEKNPERRYASCRDLAEELGRYQRGEPILARPVSKPERFWRWCRRNPAVASLTSAAALLLLIVAIVATAAYLREAHLKSVADGKTTEAQQAEAKAQVETLRATKAEADAKGERDRAQTQLEATRRENYFNEIGLAHRCYLDGETTEANRHLDLCPVSLRHWEWFYLKQVCNPPMMFLRDQPCESTYAAFSPDDSSVAFGGKDGVIRIFTSITGKLVKTLAGHKAPICGFVFRPDGRTLASQDSSKAIILWDVEAERTLWSAEVDVESVLPDSLAYSPDGKWIATPGPDKTIQLWSAADGQPQKRLPAREAGVLCLAFSPDSKRLAAGSTYLNHELGGEVVVWDVAAALPRLVISRADQFGGAGVCAIRFSPDGRTIAIGTATWLKTFDANDAEGGRCVLAQRLSTEKATQIEFGHEGRLLGISGLGFAALLDLKRERKNAGLECPGCCAAMSHDGKTWAIYGRFAAVRQCLTEPCRSAYGAVDRVARLDGLSVLGLFSALWCVREDENSGLWSRHFSGQLVEALAADEQGRCVAVGMLREDRLRIFDAPTGNLLREAELDSPVRSLAFFDHGRLLAVGKGNGTADVWDVRTWLRQTTWKNPRGDVLVAAQYNGTVVASAVRGGAGQLSFWDSQTGEFSHEFTGAGSVVAIAWSPTKEVLAVQESGGDVLLWSPERRTAKRLLVGRNQSEARLAFYPDGRRLISLMRSGRLYIWDVQSGRAVLEIQPRQGQANDVGLDREGRSLLVASSSGQTAIFDSRGYGSFRPGEVVNLVSLSDPVCDARRGDWEREGDSLRVATQESDCPLALPIEPHGSYLLRAEFTRKASKTSKTVGIILPVGGGCAMLCFDHIDRATSGLDRVDGIGVGSWKGVNPTNVKPGALEDGRRYEVEVRVRLNDPEAEIDVQLDGKPHIHWRGDQRSLSMWPSWDVSAICGGNVVGLAVGEVDVVFHKVELEMLDGQALLLRAPQTTPKPPPGAKAVPADEVIDLLRLLHPKDDCFEATVQTTDAGVKLSAEKHGRVNLPVWLRGNYEVSGSFTLPGDGMPVILTPTTRSRGLIHWRWYRDRPTNPSSAFEVIEGKNVAHADNPTRVNPSRVQVGQRHAFRVRVVCARDLAEVTVELDGEAYFRWKGPESGISLGPQWDVPHQRTIVIGVQEGQVTYHELTLKMLDGEAWLLRPKP